MSQSKQVLLIGWASVLAHMHMGREGDLSPVQRLESEVKKTCPTLYLQHKNGDSFSSCRYLQCHKNASSDHQAKELCLVIYMN